MHAHTDRAFLDVADDELDTLIGYVTAEADNEAERHCQRCLDDALDALNDGLAVG